MNLDQNDIKTNLLKSLENYIYICTYMHMYVCSYMCECTGQCLNGYLLKTKSQKAMLYLYQC